jgi:hypothetical protein
VAGKTGSVGEPGRGHRSHLSHDSNHRNRNPYLDRFESGCPDLRCEAQDRDGDLLPPTLLNAAPKIAAFFSLQSAREQLEAGLWATPTSVTLGAAVEDASLARRMQTLVGILDGPSLRGVKLTTLTKVIHRKRPAFMPLHDKFVKACYVGTQESFPMHLDRHRTWVQYWVIMATAIERDLGNQVDICAHLGALAGENVAALRVLDVVAWKAGKELVSQGQRQS